MARMLPERVPLEIERDPRHGAERRVYQALARELPANYTVLGWSSWVGRTGESSVREGELDFVVAHPAEGILVIEVKGGNVDFDPEKGIWLSRDVNGALHQIKDPYHQATVNQHALVHKLEEMPDAPPRHPFVGRAVWFPDVPRPRSPLRADAPAEISGFRENLLAPLAFVQHAMDYWRSGKVPFRNGRPAIAALEKLLAPSFHLKVALAGELQPSLERIIELTEQQYQIINGMAGNPRVLVSGAAGTGKTFLAIERARRLAEQGFRTLLCCFNRPLAEFLEASTQGTPGLTVLNYHALCHRVASEAGLIPEAPEFPDSASVPESYFSEELPRLFEQGMRVTGTRFDAIVVDEGQDFAPADRELLRKSLVQPDQDVLWVFQDAAQRIYEDKALWGEAGMFTFRLGRNLRNTQAIHALLTRISGDTNTVSAGPPGMKPKLVAAPTLADQRRQLATHLHRLVDEQQFHPGQIAILTSTRRQISDYAPDHRIDGIPTTDRHRGEAHAVLFESIPRFKGLERDVVILVGVRELEYLDMRGALYVGASRARLHLIVIDTDSVLEKLVGTR